MKWIREAISTHPFLIPPPTLSPVKWAMEHATMLVFSREAEPTGQTYVHMSIPTHLPTSLSRGIYLQTRPHDWGSQYLQVDQ